MSDERSAAGERGPQRAAATGWLGPSTSDQQVFRLTGKYRGIELMKC
jgi:hypothetical protein